MGNKNSGRHSGFKHLEITKIKISKTRIHKGIAKGINNPNFGGKWYGKKLYPNWSGKNNPHYIDGRTPLIIRIYDSKKYKDWRNSVYIRDNYTCQKCGKQGDKLEAHHKIKFIILFQEFLKEYDQFSPIEDKEILVRLAINWKPFWKIDNGQTLHKDCHLEQHPKWRKKDGTYQKNSVL